MPIEFLTDRRRAQRLGRVRLGRKMFKCAQCSEKVIDTGEHVIECPHCGRVDRTITKRNTFPAAVPYFVLNDAPALTEFYGEQPTMLNVEFLWDNLEGTFPHYLRRYTSSGLRCLGDGVVILYRVNGKGEVDVRDGNATLSNGKVKMGEDNQPVKVNCLGDQCPSYIDGSCKPTGFLRFLPVEAPRLGYYDLVCHQRAIVGIKTQLELAQAIFHHITGIPFILHRGDEEKVPVKVPGKGMVDMPIRTQWIEIDPHWFAENFPRRDEHLALSAARVRQDTIDLFGEDANGDEPFVGVQDKPLALPPVNGDFQEPLFEGEDASGQIVDGETGEILNEPAPAEIPLNGRDVSAIETLGDLWTACLEDFGLDRSRALKELGVTMQEHLAEQPRDLYLQIAVTRQPSLFS